MNTQQTTTTKAIAATKSTGAQKTAPKYTARDLAKDAGAQSASVARRYLRAAKMQRPKEGWIWSDKAAAKSAIETVQKAVRAAKADSAK
jgi:hypothetical protein